MSVGVALIQNMKIQWQSMDHTKRSRRSHQEKESSKKQKKAKTTTTKKSMTLLLMLKVFFKSLGLFIVDLEFNN